MGEYFEPVSVLSLGRVLGLPARRRRHAAALVPRARTGRDQLRGRSGEMGRLRRDRRRDRPRARARSSSGSGSKPDASTIATMLQHAEGTFEERIAAILPTLKVILLGGMQEPGHAAGSTVAGLLESGQAAALAADPAGLVRDAIEEGLRWVSPIGTQTRRARVAAELGGSSLPAGANLGVLVSSANRDEERLGADAPTSTTSSARSATMRAFGFGPHFCSGHHFSRVQMRIAVQRLFERLPLAPPGSRPAARVHRLGVPRAAAPARPLGRVTRPSTSALPISKTGALREATRGRSRPRSRPGRRRARGLRALVHARGVPAHRRLARRRSDSLRLPRRTVLARRRCAARGPATRPDPRLPCRATVADASRWRSLSCPRDPSTRRPARAGARPCRGDRGGGLAQLRPRPPDRAADRRPPPSPARGRACPRRPAVLEVLEDARRALDETIAQVRPSLLRLRRLVGARDRRSR